MINRILAVFVIIVGCILIVQSSSRTQQLRTNYTSVNALLHQSDLLKSKPFLKAHLKNGDIFILRNSWTVADSMNSLNGIGERYDFNRSLVYQGKISITIDSVAIFETNTKLNNPEGARVAALSILTGIDVIMGILCLTNPKACFGSCPTFYINEKDNFHYADAEGFSNAILPSLEYYDIDALRTVTSPGTKFSFTMKNEALETHCVNNVLLYAFPRASEEHIYHTPPADFYRCGHIYNVKTARAAEGDITTLLNKPDRVERFSRSDDHNLSSKEEVILNFENLNDQERTGLILNFRQTLMTTYFMYSAMGYMGDEVGDIFAKVETSAENRDLLESGIKKELGNIEVFVWDDSSGNWKRQHGLNETGPIAINRQFLPLDGTSHNGKLKVRLVLNKGLWRIDYTALAVIKDKVNPIVIQADSILNKGKSDRSALEAIKDPGRYLVSMPGSEYKFNFTLPSGFQEYELFLYSKGYYLEWMRAHWIKDKDLFKLQQMIYRPLDYLKTEAGDYKLYENVMEQEFWNSKIETESFSLNEKKTGSDHCVRLTGMQLCYTRIFTGSRQC